MNTDRPPAAPEWKKAEDRRASNSYLVFLGWIGVELVGFAALVLSTSNVTSTTCTGLCFSPREGLVLIGIVAGIPTLVGQVIVGLLLTMLANRNKWGSFGAGSTAFFTTFLIVAVLAGGYLASNR